MRRRFKIGDIIRCKKKYSCLYNYTDMGAFCKVILYVPEAEWRWNTFIDGKRRRLTDNVRIKIIAHKDESYVGKLVDIYDFHFRKANKRDEDTFILYRI